MWRDGITARIGALEHPAWGPAHCRRLYAMCRQLSDDEQLAIDDDVVFALAWLHDIGTFGEFACAAPTPPECAAVAAERLLAETGFPGDAAHVSRIIREHSFEGETRDTPEARILRDADMLEFLGAVGLMRLLSLVELEDWVPDPRGAVALALQFADDLPPKLHYAASRTIADERVEQTRRFARELSAQTHDLEVV